MFVKVASVLIGTLFLLQNQCTTAKRPSMVELGYAPAQSGFTCFFNIPSTSVTKCAPAKTGSSVGCNDDSKAGTLKHKTVGKIEPIVNIPGDTPGASQEKADKSINIPTSTGSTESKEKTADALVNSQDKVLKSSNPSRSAESKEKTADGLVNSQDKVLKSSNPSRSPESKEKTADELVNSQNKVLKSSSPSRRHHRH